MPAVVTPRPLPAQRCVAAFSLSAGGMDVLDSALAMAGHRPELELHIITAVDDRFGSPLVPVDGGPVNDGYAERVRTALDALVGDALDTRTEAGRALRFHVHARFGEPAEQVLGLARDLHAELILIGSHDHAGRRRSLVGSTAAKVVREAECSVIVVRGKPQS